MEYVDSNSNSVCNMEYSKPVGEDRLSHLMCKLQIDNRKVINTEPQNSANGFIGAAAASLTTSSLNNSVLTPNLSQEKLANGDIKAEVLSLILFNICFYVKLNT